MKRTFLHHLWEAQARYRTRNGLSVALSAGEMAVEGKDENAIIARTYFNVYQRIAYLRETKKVSVVEQPLINTV